jgi:5-methyltetrahydrofolate corrinoid/iron sulfur protein methyltransferase
MLIAADNINPMNKNIAKAVLELNPGPVRETAKMCADAGCDLIDINPGYLSAKNTDRIAFLIETVQEVTDCRLILDSPSPEVLKKGLSFCRQKPIISALTLEQKKITEILPLAIEADTDLVVLLLDERSFSPPRLEEKLTVALEIWQKTEQAEFPAKKLIFDPVIPNISWPEAFDQLKESTQTVRMLGEGSILGEPVRTMAGISNFLSGQRKYNDAMIEQTILSVLAGAGLSVALADVSNKKLMDTLKYVNKLI